MKDPGSGMADPRMQPAETLPFDGKRLIGFEIVLRPE